MTLDPASLTIVRYPAPVLRRPAEPVKEITATVRDVAERMFELMRIADGIGLAAPQVGLSWRMFITRGDAEIGEPSRVFINPQITTSGPLVVNEEGCLSLPGITIDVERPQSVVIRATDLDGNSFELESDEFQAVVWQHEFSHLDGKLIIDRMSPMERLRFRRVLKDLETVAKAAK